MDSQLPGRRALIVYSSTGELGKERKKEKMNRNFYIIARGFPIFLLVFFPSIIDSGVEMFTLVASRSRLVPLVGGRLMMMMESSRRHRTILCESGEVNGVAKGVPIHILKLSLFFFLRCKFLLDTGKLCVSTRWIHHGLLGRLSRSAHNQQR